MQVILVGFLLSVFASWSAALADDDPTDAFDSYQLVSGMQAHPDRERIPGGLPTKYGTQIDPSCFSEPLVAAKDAERVKRNFEAFIGQAVTKVMGDCADRYPEAGAYFNSWASKMRKTAFFCTRRVPDANDYYKAMNVRAWPNMVKNVTPEEAQYLDKTPGYPREAANDAGGPIVLLAPEMMNIFKTTTPYSPEMVDLIIHEGFHSTGANNRSDHNQIETLSSRSCNLAGGADDRVVVMSSLCSGYNIENSLTETAQEMLYDRMLKCGREKGCEAVFSTTTSKGIPSQKLTNPAAMCAKVFNEGCCHDLLKTDEGKRLLLSHPYVTSRADKVVSRLDALLPRSRDHIPAAALAPYPALSALSADPAGRKCLESAFDISADGELHVKTSVVNDWTKEEDGSKAKQLSTEALRRPLTDDERWGPSGGFDWRDTFRQAVFGLSRAPGCDSVASAFKGAATDYGQALGSPAFRSLVANRKLKGFEEHADPDKIEAPESLPMNQALKRLVNSGQSKDIYEDYVSAVKRTHFESPGFSCARTGLWEAGALGCYEKLRQREALGCQDEAAQAWWWD